MQFFFINWWFYFWHPWENFPDEGGRAMQYSQEARQLLCRAAEKARSLGHSYVGSIHLLIALTGQRGFAGYLLNSFGIHQEMTAHMAMILYGRGSSGVPLRQGFSKQASLILRGAALEARQNQSTIVEPVHIFLSLLQYIYNSSKYWFRSIHIYTVI